ncbi:2Fe-2S iron-sulfur cluster-binding protein [Haloterrigena salifodinae]|uniref:2Fe-2S iron-sulfur cluster-binding protein n=1 Tax=Haloterrigena salifodinae TaxID=2675099 RepID=UPI000F87AD14|nr:2Fe-2S iron-sulfur cluster-binding protein [Haloterrigena salifodinae]
MTNPKHTVEFVDSGATLEVSETETILQACLEAGIASEYSCRVGACVACTAEIVAGDVVQPAARGLTAEEADSYALTCMARPQSDLELRLGKYPPSIEASTNDDAERDG